MTGRLYSADVIRERVGIEEFARLLEELGATVNRRTGRSTCPVHGGDNREALHYNEKDGAILSTCFTGCGGKTRDAFQIVMDARGLDFPSAVEWLGDFLGITPEAPRKPSGTASAPSGSGSRATPAAPPPAAPAPDLAAERAARLARLWEAFALADEKAECYLRSRGIAPDPSLVRFNVGGTGDEEADRLAASGYRIAVPLRAVKDGSLVSFQFRLAEDPADEKILRKRNLRGSLEGAVFGLPGGIAAIGEKDPLLLAEGLTDYLASAPAGGIGEAGGPRVRLVGFPGAGGAKKLPETFGAELLRGRAVLLALDQDEAGEGAARELARALLRVGAKPYRVRTRAKDVSAEIAESGEAPLSVLLAVMNAAAEAGTWDPDARDAPAEWARALDTWKATFEKTGIPTGFPSVDDLLGGGWRGRRLYVLGGLTGSGKSAFSLRCAHAAAEAGIPVLIVQYEVEDAETRIRLLAPETGIFYGRALTPDLLSIEEKERLSSAWGRYAAGPGSRIFVSVPEGSDEKPRPGSIEWVKGEAKRISERFERPPLVIVDYLQPAAALSEDYAEDGNLRLAAGKVSLGLRELSRSLSCPVLALSSVPRGAYLKAREGYRLPELGDLKESGEIEFNADSVLYLWPEEEDWKAHEGEGIDRDSLASRPMILRAVKGRQTGGGKVALSWNPPLGTFEDKGKPKRPEKAPRAKKDEKKPFDVDALTSVIAGHGSIKDGVFEIEEERLRKIVKSEFNVSVATVDGIVAMHPKRFERIKRSEGSSGKITWIRYVSGGAN